MSADTLYMFIHVLDCSASRGSRANDVSYKLEGETREGKFILLFTAALKNEKDTAVYSKDSFLFKEH